MDAPQTLVIADILRRNRRQAFVGRRAELDFLRAVFAAPRWPFHLLSVVGPAGIGKTALLREAAYLAEDGGMPSHWLDLEGSDERLADLPRRVRELVAEEAGTGVSRQVLFLDGVGTFGPEAIDAWMAILALVPADWLLVMGSRDVPPAAWELDPAWRGLHRSLHLAPLSQEESLTNLSQLHVPSFRQPEIAERAAGVPLVHSLAATHCHGRASCCAGECAVHELVHALAGTLADSAPSPLHRRALYAASLLARTTEDLLGAMLGIEDAHDIHRWLSARGFTGPGRMGLRLTRPYRQALEEDLRWRNPSLHRDLVERGIAYCVGRLRARRDWDGGEEQLLLNAFYLRRGDPMPGLTFRWDPDEDLLCTPLEPADALHLTTMVRAQAPEGEAGWVQRWIETRPEAFIVCRDAQGLPRGFLLFTTFASAEALEDHAWDPVVKQVADRSPFEGASGPVAVLRTWMDADAPHRPGTRQIRLFASLLRQLRALDAPAGVFLRVHTDGRLPRLLRGLGFEALSPAGTEGPVLYGRRGGEQIVGRFLRFLEMAGDEGLEADGPPVVELDPAAFEQAVRRALKDYTAPDQLRHNPLLDTSLVRLRAGDNASWATRVEVLRREIVVAAETLAESPRRRKAYEALRATYLEPEPTQEAAAEAVEMPFSTYRRYLGRGIRWMAELMRTRTPAG